MIDQEPLTIPSSEDMPQVKDQPGGKVAEVLQQIVAQRRVMTLDGLGELWDRLTMEQQVILQDDLQRVVDRWYRIAYKGQGNV